MPTQRHYLRQETKSPAFWLTYVLAVIFVYHGLIVFYSSSTYMEQFATPEVIGALFTIGSSLSVFGFLFISRILKVVGNVRLTIWLALAEIVTLILVGMAFSPALTIVAFVLFLAINPLIFLNIDIFSESLIGKNESTTGSKRGLSLTLMSLAAAAGPFTLGLIVGDDNARLNLPYFAAAFVFLGFIALVLVHFRSFKDPKYKEVRVLSAIRSFWIIPDLRNVFMAHFTMQLFFAWSIIYFPLYLATEIGFGWDTIGFMISFALLAYVIVEYPAGILADKYVGEKEMMAVGFVILAVTSSWVVFMTTAPIISWLFLMFISRIGASLVEVSTESYFFKHTKGSDANIIGFFRLTRPLAMVVGSLLGSAALLFLPFNFTFVILGLIMIPGALFASRLKDTK